MPNSDSLKADLPERFQNMGLSEPILKAIGELGYEAPTPIQALAIPQLAQGRDIIGQAQTGTGKTAAFALPLLDKVDIAEVVPQLLVLTPTRELALQVCEAVKSYSRHFERLKVLPVYGGQGMSNQLRALRRGVHVVVGTPGRLLDHLDRGTLDLANVRALVLDEADEMLRMGFVDEVEKIMERLPETRQTALFSATMPPPIAKIAKRFLSDPAEVRVQGRETTVESITQQFVMVSGEVKKLEALTRILEMEDFDGMIIFVRTRVATVGLAEKLEARGYGALALNGDMNQQSRQRTVDRFKGGDFDILVCTDVAARGLDVPRISHVLNYDIPFDTEVYVHRIGRTGRAGRDGKAILFAGKRERRMLTAIERATGKKIERLRLPTGAQIGERRIQQFKELLTTTIESNELSFFRAVIDSYCEEAEKDPISAAAALAYLFQRNRPFAIAETQIEDMDRQDERRPRSESKGRKKSARSTAIYRIEVGSEHGLEPRDLVGALTNEIDLPGSYIGTIRIGQKHTTVELPAGMPPEVLEFLQGVRVRGERLRMSLLSADSESQRRPSRRPRGKPERSSSPSRRSRAKSKPRTKRRR